MGVPEGFKGLLANLCVGSTVHHDHDEEHDVASNTSRLLVVNIECIGRTQLTALDVDKVHIVGSGVDHTPECHGISDLTMEPDVFIRREEPGELGTNDTDHVAKHRDQDKTTIESENETGTTGDPDRESQGVETGELCVRVLRVPTICENSDVCTVPEDVEDWRVRPV